MSTGSKSIVSKPAALRVYIPVTLKTQPKSQTVKVGHSAVFRVSPQGTGPFYYQWYSNSVPISQAYKSFYSIPKVQPEYAAEYSAIVQNLLSEATSTNAVLTVVP
jgi:hypothetical protein